jgi:hypothetical protein
MSGGPQLVLQAAIGNGLPFDPFPFCQDGRAPSEVDIRRGEVVDALVVAAMVADSGDVARSFRDHVARCSDMMSPAWGVLLAGCFGEK